MREKRNQYHKGHCVITRFTKDDDKLRRVADDEVGDTQAVVEQIGNMVRCEDGHSYDVAELEYDNIELSFNEAWLDALLEEFKSVHNLPLLWIDDGIVRGEWDQSVGDDVPFYDFTDEQVDWMDDWDRQWHANCEEEWPHIPARNAVKKFWPEHSSR